MKAGDFENGSILVIIEDKEEIKKKINELMDDKREEIYVYLYEDDVCNHGKEKFRTDASAEEVISTICDIYNFTNKS